MAVLTEGNRSGDIVLFEEDKFYSREEVTIASGANLKAGAVLGKITVSGKYQLSAIGAADGSETPSAVLITDANADSVDVSGAIVIARHATIMRAGLIFDATINDSTKRNAALAALKAVGILSDA